MQLNNNPDSDTRDIKLKPYTIVTVLLLTQTVASFADENRWYIGGGLSRFELDKGKSTFRQSARGLPVIGTPAQEFDFDSDIDGDTDIALVGGWDAQDYDIRFEFQYQEYASDIKSFRGNGSEQIVSGEAEAQQLLAMAYYDIRNINFIASDIRPYLGLGVGAIKLKLSGEGDKGVMAQFGLGISYDLFDYLTLDFGYRYFKSEDVDYEFDNGALTTEYKGDAIILNVRWYVDSTN